VRIYRRVFICNQKHERQVGLSENSSEEIVNMQYKNQGYQMKVTSKTSSRRCPFTEQVLTLWKSLPQDAAGTTSLQAFKKQQYKCMEKEK